MNYRSRDLRILQELIHPDAQILPTDDHRPQLILQEIEEDHPYQVTIRCPRETEAIALKADKFPAPKQFFAGSRKECKRADYLIFAETPQGNYIICVEMKAGPANNDDIIAQLKGAQCLATYCREIGRIFWHEYNFLQGYGFRFVSLKHMRLSKPPSRPLRKSKSRHDRPEDRLTLFSTTELPLHKLI